jgi:hypothetical protein
MDCGTITNMLSSLSSVFAILLVISELLPYASSSKCNSLIEGASHVFCRTSCLVSNKNIRFENDEMRQEITSLRLDKKDLIDEINHLKKVVLADMANDIKKLRISFDLHKTNNNENLLNNVVIEE